MIEVYRGSPNAWECDEMGHMNVRFYLAKLMEGVGVFCHEMGMPQAFKINAPSTVKLKDLHIRFLREAHAGLPFYMKAGVVGTLDTSVKVYFQLNHLDDTPCAVFRCELEHIDIHTDQAFLWSPKTIEFFNSIPAEMPDQLGPRSISVDTPPLNQPTMQDVEKIHPIRVGTGLILPDQCDVFGNMKTEFFIGRLSDSAPHLADTLDVGMTRSPTPDDTEQRIGTAALEYRFAFHNLPSAGDSFHIYAGLGEQQGKTWGVHYWIMDPNTQLAYATAQATLVRFDLDKRKAVMPPEGSFETMQKVIPKGLWF
ncbi:acyl-ACP thioesterase [Hirschia maritima]|uniref:acyl-ACP thioesterase n=1 Tax=Hirschia maritima TaxID=1121961 RepID=UPI0003751DA5|nr:acyl-ACP thioesterase [Hirschia maritima]